MAQRSSRERAQLGRALFPALATELDAALERHGRDAAASLDAWLDDTASALLTGAGLDDVIDRAARDRFEQAFAAGRTAADALGVALPEPEAFAASGVDFGRLGAALAADPELLPVAAPHGLGASVWRRAFDGTDDSTAGVGLVLASEAVREFDVLDTPAPGPPGGTPTTAVPPVVEQPGAVSWTLRLVPAGQRPQRLGLGFAHGPHPTLPEMLMLQLMRLARGEEPVDAASFTWLAGPLADGRLAARHVYDLGERTVRISCREIGSQGPHLGARPPIG